MAKKPPVHLMRCNGIPIRILYDENLVQGQAVISDELMEACHQALKVPGFMDALTELKGIRNTDEIQQICKMKNGLLLLVVMRGLLPGCAYTPEEALATARRVSDCSARLKTAGS